MQNYLHVSAKMANFAVKLTTREKHMISITNEGSVSDIRQWICQELGTNQMYFMGQDFFYIIGCHVLISGFDHTLYDIAVIICKEGRAHVRLNGEPIELCEHTLLVMMKGYHVCVEEVSEDFSFDLVVMSDRFAASLQIQDKLSANLDARKEMALWFNDKKWEYLKRYMQIIVMNLRQNDHPFRAQILVSLLGLMYFQFRFDDPLPVETPKKDDLTKRFIDLLNIEYKHHHDSAFYANCLCVTPKYLSECVKKSSGKTAVQWIDDMVIAEAERLLRYTSLSVNEIASDLGFEDPSAFGKYFKRAEGVSPRNYRGQGGARRL